MPDVTGERLRELEEAEERLRLVAENVDEVILIASADLSEIQYVNPAYEDVYGQPVERLYERPRSFLDSVHPEDREAYEADVEAMLADFERDDPKQVYEGEYRLRNEDGERPRWIHVSRYPVVEDEAGARDEPPGDGTGGRDGDPTVERFVVVVEEVTERREYERAYREVFESGSDGLVVHDPASGEVLDANERFCGMNGYDREELVGETIDVVTASGEGYSYEEAHRYIQLAHEEGPQLFEWRNERKDGSTFPVEVHLTVAEIRGEERVLASVRDITERKRHERIVRALHESTERLQDAETPERVCEATVEAAEEVVGLSMPACWLHDEEGSVLEPVAAPDPAWEVPGGPGTFEPGSVGYEVFERGEMDVYDPSERRERTPLERGVLIPLGEHGLLGIAEPGVGSYDDVVLDAARTLARHATTALDRVERAEERRESERRLRAVLERIDEAVFLTEEAYPERWTGKPDYLSSGYEEIWGRPYEEFADGNRGSILETVHEADRPAYRGLLDRVVEDIERGDPEDSYAHEYRIERPDGEVRWIHSDLYPLRWTDERYRLVIVSRDVTERRHREREYEQIFDSVNDAITVHDPETGEILDVNETMCDLVGYDREAVLDAGIAGLSVAEEGYTAERGREVIRRVMESGESEVLEWKAETADGDHRWLEVNATPASIGGEPRYLAIQRDVTGRKRRERMIRNLHESTDDLQEAETVEAVCEATVTAMEEVLDLSLPVCWLRRDEESPVLEPVAASDAAMEFAGGPGPLEPGTFEYDLFERGESAVYDPSERWDRTSLSHALMVPMGEYGVLGAADPGVEEFEDVTLDAARILARHATTALDRVERARELRESERRFRLIAERIDEVIFLSEPDFSELFYVNDAYEELWGEPVETLFEDPRGFVDGIDPRDREAFEAEFEAMLADIERGEAEDSYTFEYRVRRPDGSARWVRATGYPVELDAEDAESEDDGDGDTRFVGIVEDVTERRELERTYRAVFENVSDGLVVHEPETGEILDVNERYCELTGYSEEELVGGNVRLIVPEDPSDTYADARARIEAAREEGSQLFEFEGERKDGSRFVGEVHLSTVELRGEERVLASVRDVTDRRRRKRELRRLTEEYETIFENAQDALFFVDVERPGSDPAFVYRRTNEAHEEQTGFPTDDVAGKTPRELCGEELGAEIAANYRRCVEARETITYEEELDLPAGEKVWQTKLSPVIIDGEVTQIVGIARDITEQREREETLETFHDATRELVSAGSRREASRMAVTAAERVLGFPLVSVHLYDEEGGSLEPVAATDTLESVLDFLPSFDPGPSLPWQVFVDGESVRTAEVGGASGVYGRGVSDPDVVLPLGPHGVMLVGAPDEEFDPGRGELARILAATLQAALGHVRGQRELEERESELEAHRERADRLERLNTVIREIEQATVEESSREAVERAVCDHLTTVEPYREAWIAEPNVTGDTLVTRTSDGDGSGGAGYAETLEVDLGNAGNGVAEHPARAAFRTGEVRTAGSLATSTAQGEWRKPVLRAGYQSMVAVPLAGKEAVHGVLCIAADDPAAFDEDTEEILAELGRSVGHAVSVLERRAALESDTTTELEFEVADEGLSVVWLASETGAEVTLERTVRRPDGEFGAFYTVEGADPDRVVDRAAAAPDAEAAHAISEDDETCLVEVRTSSWFGTTFTEYGAVVRTATAEDGEGRLVVEAPRAADVRTLVESFRERYPDTELVAQRTRERAVQTLLELQDLLAEQLTPRQLEALETAYSAGYFDWPRESSGEEIAELLGVTQPTFNKHLRTAERKAFSMLLEREYSE